MTPVRPTIPEAQRLERVRLEYLGGISLADFHRTLTETDDYQVSYAGLRNYHTNRKAPADFYVQVSRVFGVRLEWLLMGEGEMIQPPAPGLAEVAGKEEWVRDLQTIAPTAWTSADPVAQAAFLECVRKLDLARPSTTTLTLHQRRNLARILDTLVAGILWILRGDREAPGPCVRSLLLALATGLPAPKQGSTYGDIVKRMKLEADAESDA